jgi:hypothetical protein
MYCLPITLTGPPLISSTTLAATYGIGGMMNVLCFRMSFSFVFYIEEYLLICTFGQTLFPVSSLVRVIIELPITLSHPDILSSFVVH